MKIYDAIERISILSKGGSTAPWLVKVLVEDEGEPVKFVAKVFKKHTLAQYNAVGHEVMAHTLAELLGLSVPEKAFIHFGKTFCGTLDENEFKDIDYRPKFATRYQEQTALYTQALTKYAPSIYDMANIYAFDNLIYNTDRREGKPNLLVYQENYFLIDHELSIEGITKDSIMELKNQNSLYQYQKHIFYTNLFQLSDKNGIFEEISEQIKFLNINELYKCLGVLQAHGYNSPDLLTFIKYVHYVKENPSLFIQFLNGQIA